MARRDSLACYLPLSEATFYIMLVLIETLHGYAIMQRVERISDHQLTIGPGTLYGALGTLQKQGLIEMVRTDGRRKYYALTGRGRQVLRRQIERLEMMSASGRQVLDQL